MEIFRFLRSEALFQEKPAGVGLDAMILFNLSELGSEAGRKVHVIRAVVERARGEAIFGPDVELEYGREEGVFWKKPWREP